MRDGDAIELHNPMQFAGHGAKHVFGIAVQADRLRDSN